MDSVQKLPLNQGQQAAADGFFEFLFDDSKRELNISGPGGVGKTFLMGYLIDETMTRYFDTCKMLNIDPQFDEVVMTATTNKAAEVLGLATGRPTSTIHSFLNLKVRDDFATGKSFLTKSSAFFVHQRKIIFIDECSMIDTPLRNMIKDGTMKCKIIYVGDHCQLAPVMESLSPIYRDNLPMYELTEPMRNADQPALMALCNQLRQTVETGVFNPIQIVPGVVDWFDDKDMEREVDSHFLSQTLDARILAYMNSRVGEFNEHIRDLRKLPPDYTKGELLVNNSAIRHGNSMLSVEEQVAVMDCEPKTEKVILEPNVELEIRYMDLETRLGVIFLRVPVPVDRSHFDALVKYYARKKDWRTYFELKNTYPDLRPHDAATVHKAQGSTYDTVFIDVGNISNCHNPDAAARLLYVAASRARTRIILYGLLADKYGGLTY
jgi:hypothetical protein